MSITGPGRGAALLFVGLGLLNVAVGIAGASCRCLWRLDSELPDFSEEGQAVAATEEAKKARSE